MAFTIKNKDNDIQFDCHEEDTILRAAVRAGVKMSYECNSGGCGSCKFDLQEGELESLWDNPPGLSRRDIRKGKKLACQCKPTSDCQINFRLDNWQSPDYPPQRFTVRYLGRRDLTEDMAEFRFQSDRPAHFLPGQYAMMSFPDTAQIKGDRAYSMSNISNEAGYWQFIIKQMPEGTATHYLFDKLQEGAEINLDGPYGLAYLRTNIERDIVCIGGGSGLSPIMSIVRAITGDEKFNQRKVKMFYGGRSPKDICTPALLSEIDPLDTEFVCHNATSDIGLSVEQGWDGECCFVHELVEKTLGERMPEYEFYFCGPPPMTEAVQRLLMINYKVPFQQIHFDRFF